MDLMRKGTGVGHFSGAFFSVLSILVFLAITGGYASGYVKDDGALRLTPGDGVTPSPLQKGTSIALPAGQDDSYRRIYTVEDGDSFFEILKSNGLSGEEALSIIKKTRHVFNTSRIKPGNEIQFIFSPTDQSLVHLDYEISDLERLVIKISGDHITARKVDLDKDEHFIPSTDSAPIRADRFQAQPGKSGYAVRTQDKGKPSIEPSYPGQRKVDVKIRKGHSLFDILNGLGVSRIDIDIFTRSVRKVYNLADLKQGRTLNIWLTQDSPVKIKRLTYEIDDTNYLDVTSRKGSFIAKTRTLTRDVRYESAEGKIRGSLYESAIAEGINPEIVIKLTDIFAHDINFFSEVHPGDTYSILYEKYYVKDQFKGYGRIMAAKFVNRGQKHLAFYYSNKRKDIIGYYDEKGNPINKKMFLRAPLNYRRISSLFSHNRKHPIFGVVRPHLGVDYAAPTGTPICSLGPGKVIFKGWQKGFGNTIRVKHPEGYVSYYGHLSRFAKGLQTGKKVDQGDTIGYVGSTGYSTGPHLDFRVSCNNKFINPLKMKNVTGPALRGSALADFKRLKSRRLAVLEGKTRNIALSREDING